MKNLILILFNLFLLMQAALSQDSLHVALPDSVGDNEAGTPSCGSGSRSGSDNGRFTGNHIVNKKKKLSQKVWAASFST